MKKKLTLLIFTACAVFVGSVGLVFWALASTQVNVTSGLLVTYTPGLHVVCDVNATYQRTNDSSAIAFSQGNLSLKYNGTITDTTLEATSSALQLDDSNTYVVFEFTFVNTNQQPNYDLTITLTDNGTVTNMTRKYYFGDLSSSNISAKRTTIKNSGIDNSSLSSQKLVLGYQETGRIYMLLEITPGTVASYLADNTNKFAFTLTTAEHQVEAVSYLHPKWAEIIYRAPNNASMTHTNSTQEPILAAPSFVTFQYPYQDIIFTKDVSLTIGLTNSVSVGTISETSTASYTQTAGISDITAYWGNDITRVVIYSPVVIYAPEDCYSLFSGAGGTLGFGDLSKLDLGNFDTSKVTSMSSMFSGCSSLTSLDVSNFDTSNVTNMLYMFESCSSLTSLDVSNFDTSNVTNMKYMFSGCSSLTSLDVSNFDTSKVTTMLWMFYYCESITSLDLGNFNLASCTSFGSMLYGCSALASITLPYNLQSGYTIDLPTLPANTIYTGLESENIGRYAFTKIGVGTDLANKIIRCSTADNKVLVYKSTGGVTDKI